MEPFVVQVVVDTADPHDLADWWAQTLRWHVESQDEAFIRTMIEQGHATESDTTRHGGALVWRTGAAINPHADRAEQGPRILFQLVPEDKVVKNRMHLDVRVGGEDLEEVRASLIERGATVLHEGCEGPHAWVTMADPEGNEFCL